MVKTEKILEQDVIHKNNKMTTFYFMKSVVKYKHEEQSNQANNQDYFHIIYLRHKSHILTKHKAGICF